MHGSLDCFVGWTWPYVEFAVWNKGRRNFSRIIHLPNRRWASWENVYLLYLSLGMERGKRVRREIWSGIIERPSRGQTSNCRKSKSRNTQCISKSSLYGHHLSPLYIQKFLVAPRDTFPMTLWYNLFCSSRNQICRTPGHLMKVAERFGNLWWLCLTVFPNSVTQYANAVWQMTKGNGGTEGLVYKILSPVGYILTGRFGNDDQRYVVFIAITCSISGFDGQIR